MGIRKEILLNLLKEGMSISNKEFDKLTKVHGETIAHVIRCFKIAEEFGKYLGFKKEDVKLLSICSLYHDIGKFHIEPSILYKNDRLSEEEFNIIKGHVDYRYNGSNKAIKDSILYHHERPDNKGYKGKNYKSIHNFSKIIAIIDCYDTMVNRRCYKNNTLNINEVISEINDNLGKQFDSNYGKLFTLYLKSIIENIAV